MHPDEWDLDGLEKVVLERFKVKLDLAQVEPNLDKLVDRIWKQVEAQLTQREQEFGLPVEGR